MGVKRWKVKGSRSVCVFLLVVGEDISCMNNASACIRVPLCQTGNKPGSARNTPFNATRLPRLLSREECSCNPIAREINSLETDRVSHLSI